MNAGILERRLLEAEQTIARLSAQVANIQARPANISSAPAVRSARTYNNGSYPGSGNTFPATFVDVSFTASGGTHTPTIVERGTSNVIFVHNMLGSTIPVDKLIPIVEINGQYYTWYGGAGTDDSDGFVRIKAATGSPETCDNVSRNGSTCVYTGAVVELDGDPNFCSDPFTESTTVWVADVDRCDPTTTLKYNDVYHARKVSDAYAPSISAEERPLYLIRGMADSVSSDVKIIKATSASGSACDVASEVSLSECIWNAKLQAVSVAGSSMCSPFSDGADIFAFKLSSCCDTTIRKDERYLALKVGSYTSSAAAATRDMYAIVGSYCTSAQFPRLAYANGRIDANGSGSAYIAEEVSLGGLLSTTESAVSVTVKNPLNGDIMDGTRILIQPIEAKRNGSATYFNAWAVCPMDLAYRAKAVSTIATNSSGSVTIYPVGSPAETVTAYHDWIDDGDITPTMELFITWFRGNGEYRWRITGASCA